MKFSFNGNEEFWFHSVKDERIDLREQVKSGRLYLSHVQSATDITDVKDINSYNILRCFRSILDQACVSGQERASVVLSGDVNNAKTCSTLMLGQLIFETTEVDLLSPSSDEELKLLSKIPNSFVSKYVAAQSVVDLLTSVAETPRQCVETIAHVDLAYYPFNYQLMGVQFNIRLPDMATLSQFDVFTAIVHGMDSNLKKVTNCTYSLIKSPLVNNSISVAEAQSKFQNFYESLKLLKFHVKEIEAVIRIFVAVLYISISDVDPHDPCLPIAEEMLGYIQPDESIDIKKIRGLSRLIKERSYISDTGLNFAKENNASEMKLAKDQLCANLYNFVSNWIVWRANNVLKPNQKCTEVSFIVATDPVGRHSYNYLSYLYLRLKLYQDSEILRFGDAEQLCQILVEDDNSIVNIISQSLNVVDAATRILLHYGTQSIVRTRIDELDRIIVDVGPSITFHVDDNFLYQVQCGSKISLDVLTFLRNECKANKFVHEIVGPNYVETADIDGQLLFAQFIEFGGIKQKLGIVLNKHIFRNPLVVLTDWLVSQGDLYKIDCAVFGAKDTFDVSKLKFSQTQFISCSWIQVQSRVGSSSFDPIKNLLKLFNCQFDDQSEIFQVQDWVLAKLLIRLSSKSDIIRKERAQTLMSKSSNALTPPQYVSETPAVSPQDRQNWYKCASDEAFTSSRSIWLKLVWLCTWYIPDSLYIKYWGMNDAKARLANREKITLCVLIAILNILFVCVLPVLQAALCPQMSSNPFYGFMSVGEVYLSAQFTSKALFVKNGKVYDASFVPLSLGDRAQVYEYAGQDISVYPRTDSLAFSQCNQLSNSKIQDLRRTVDVKSYRLSPLQSIAPVFDNSAVYKYEVGQIVYADFGNYRNYTNGGVWIQIDNSVYNLTEYYGKLYPPFFDDRTEDIIQQYAGNKIPSDVVLQMEPGFVDCLDKLYKIGKFDYRTTTSCVAISSFTNVVYFIIVAVVLFKFAAAFSISWKHPFGGDKKSKTDQLPGKLPNVVYFIPCYTESKENIQQLVSALSQSEYAGGKLLFIICDGMIVGQGNTMVTPAIVLDVLKHKRNGVPSCYPYESLGTDKNSINYAQIDCGVYNEQLPYIVVSKVGRPDERFKPGNRGKRDSQMLLLRLLSRMFYHQQMSPLELELNYLAHTELGLRLEQFDACLMIDADTIVSENGIQELGRVLQKKPNVIGVAGVTQVSNPNDSIFTTLQVFEYFNNHFYAKAFESLFGTVTCLPGCFSMYRLADMQNRIPYLISRDILTDYGVTQANTLHEKNLLSLGEDRYLTTLMLKHFPRRFTAFAPNAQCETAIPHSWSVFLSQRRRWINSTVHNLAALYNVSNLCGLFCFSMRFIVLLDFVGTIMSPGMFIYGLFIVLQAIISPQAPISALLTILCVVGSQVLICLSRGELKMLLYMVVNMIAFPVYALVLPSYAFYKFDDFSWGSTRKLAETHKDVGDGDLKDNINNSLKNDMYKIPLAQVDTDNPFWRSEDYQFAKRVSYFEHNQDVLQAVSPLSPTLKSAGV
ncbi:hypothetical protein MP228_004680 [Amoeboaphelidium protococcarum]|nr:hypothetical protein MP228_004680 [Amoeboaphelidium protococcarum]